MANAALLETRSVLAITGADTRPFLQGLISNDVTKVTPARAIWAALLTAQGKWLHDFFVTEVDGALLLEAERDRLPDLAKRLRLYKLRSQIDIAPRDDLAVAALWPESALDALGLAHAPGAAAPRPGGVVHVDPRLARLGARAVVPRADLDATLAGFERAPVADYDRLRLSLGVPDGSRDFVTEKSILLENGVDELNGVDWKKGCYVGQELTARTKYRGLIKKRLMPVGIDGPLPAPGTLVMLGTREAGEMRSAADGIGLALLRLEMVDAAALEGEPLRAGEATLRVQRPDWMKIEPA
ncbi:MAG: folate-binding protein YgfZ [Alphaproteobacteria bacterium]|nr:folate-binding protein YgfZ [Alphaproteobacteria bacterium]